MKNSTKYSKEFSEFVFHLQQFESQNPELENIPQQIPKNYTSDDGYPLAEKASYYFENYDSLTDGETRFLKALKFVGEKTKAEEKKVVVAMRSTQTNAQANDASKIVSENIKKRKKIRMQVNRYTVTNDFSTKPSSDRLVEFFIISKNMEKRKIIALITKLNYRAKYPILYDDVGQNERYKDYYVLKTAETNIVNAMLITPINIRELEKRFVMLDGNEKMINTPIDLKIDCWIAGYVDSEVLDSINKNAFIEDVAKIASDKAEEFLQATRSAQYNKPKVKIHFSIADEKVVIDNKPYSPIILKFDSEYNVDRVGHNNLTSWRKEEFVESIAKRMCALQYAVDSYIKTNFDEDPKKFFLIPTSPVGSSVRKTKDDPCLEVHKSQKTKTNESPKL